MGRRVISLTLPAEFLDLAPVCFEGRVVFRFGYFRSTSESFGIGEVV